MSRETIVKNIGLGTIISKVGGREKYSFFKKYKRIHPERKFYFRSTVSSCSLALYLSIPCVARMTKCLRQRILGRE